ncbi:uncharacterized protein FOMMEDRAFT_86396 [Fomitiporia mediterranea MF3/22]|uniref:uncharacterized protein n=1 Tax=Fomitiporia mediterranea (strain MF3/22) TaxID=694068 RepID=UPI0004408A57|nr:uncharacterized protein FOMMEDRAFT_86396 [Fomitiporia mediterranea MF3/22]EJD03294.1 hypothetical protein FOMMEDRAFT_86396 [Fomitiporia mediterranea MF3/22]
MTFYYPTNPSISLTSKTLIVPVVSVGNVSQLAADLLISTFELEQIGVFDPQDLVPVIGAREDGAGVSTPLELYGKDGKDILVIQQRSPVLKSRKAAFSTSLLAFIQENNIGAVLYLTGVDLTNRSDAQMLSPTYMFSAANSPALDTSPISLIKQLPTYKFESSERSPTPSPSIPFIPGGGLTRRLLALSSSPSSISKSNKKPIPSAAILQFVLEGDNRADAEFFAGVVARILKLQVEQWRQPPSWSVGLFGTPHDQTLYG